MAEERKGAVTMRGNPMTLVIPDVLEETCATRQALERLAYQVFAWVMTHPRIYEFAGRIASYLTGVQDKLRRAELVRLFAQPLACLVGDRE